MLVNTLGHKPIIVKKNNPIILAMPDRPASSLVDRSHSLHEIPSPGGQLSPPLFAKFVKVSFFGLDPDVLGRRVRHSDHDYAPAQLVAQVQPLGYFAPADCEHYGAFF
jgi:hypothetical protein